MWLRPPMPSAAGRPPPVAIADRTITNKVMTSQYKVIVFKRAPGACINIVFHFFNAYNGAIMQQGWHNRRISSGGKATICQDRLGTNKTSLNELSEIILHAYHRLEARSRLRNRKRHFLLSAFAMFVPSLSWQSDRFSVQNGAKSARSAPPPAPPRTSQHSRCHREAPHRPAHPPAEKHLALLKFPYLWVCLSRACLGKMIFFTSNMV